jgi:hypothetical protein
MDSGQLLRSFRNDEVTKFSHCVFPTLDGLPNLDSIEDEANQLRLGP